MKLGYNFNNTNAIVALQHVHNMLQASANCYAIAYNSVNDITYLYSFSKATDNIEEFELKPDDNINELRKHKKQNYQWLLSGSLSFLNTIPNKKSITIFSEQEKTILSIRITNTINTLCDLILIEFKQDVGMFNLSLLHNNSDIKYKDMLAELIVASIKALLKQTEKERETFNKISNHVSRILEVSQENKAIAEKEKTLHKQSISNLVKEYVAKLSNQYERVFIISDEALNLLWEHRDSMFAMQDMVEDAIIFSLSQFPKQNSAIVLHKEYFTIPTKNQTTTKSIIGEVNSDFEKNQRIEQFLYRIKAGVELTIAKRLATTGKNVGSLCTPPITAPGITEYISKHTVSIASIIQNNPERWLILTEHFKPIQNLMANASMRLKKAN